MIELLVVLGIIAILAGITFGLVSGVSERGRTARAQTELRLIAQALEQYRSHYGDYPWVNFLPDYTYHVDAYSPDGERRDETPEFLFNALIGVFGPRGADLYADNDNQYARSFIEIGRLTLYSDAPADVPDRMNPMGALDNAFVDPWGNRYRYRYRDINEYNPGVAGWTVDDLTWERQGFILYSMGPNGNDDAPTPRGTIPETGENADNIHHDD